MGGGNTPQNSDHRSTNCLIVFSFFTLNSRCSLTYLLEQLVDELLVFSKGLPTISIMGDSSASYIHMVIN